MDNHVIYYRQFTDGDWTHLLEIFPSDETSPLTGTEPRVELPSRFLVNDTFTHGWEKPKTPLGATSASTMKVTVNIGALRDYATGTHLRNLYDYISNYGETVWTLKSNQGYLGIVETVEFQGATAYYHGEKFKYNTTTHNNTTELELISTAKRAMESVTIYDVASMVAACCSTIDGATPADFPTFTSLNRANVYETVVYDNSTGPGYKFVYGRRAHSSLYPSDSEMAIFVRWIDFYTMCEILIAQRFAEITRATFDVTAWTHWCEIITTTSATDPQGGYNYVAQYKQDYTAAHTRGALIPKNEEYMLAFVALNSDTSAWYSGLLGDPQSGLQKEYKNLWDMFQDEVDAGMCQSFARVVASDNAGQYKCRMDFAEFWQPTTTDSVKSRPDTKAFMPEMTFGIKGHQSSGCVANAVEPLEGDTTEQRYLSDDASQNISQVQARMMLTTSPSANIDTTNLGDSTPFLYDALDDSADSDFSGPNDTKFILLSGGFNFAKVYYFQQPVSGGGPAWINGANSIPIACYHAPTVTLGDIDETPYLLTSYAVAWDMSAIYGTIAGPAAKFNWIELYIEWCKEVQNHGWATLTAQVSGMITARGDNDVVDAVVRYGHSTNSFALNNNPFARFAISATVFDDLYKPTLPLDSVLIKSEIAVKRGNPTQTIQLWTRSVDL